jgi:hypothetical protein
MKKIMTTQTFLALACIIAIVSLCTAVTVAEADDSDTPLVKRSASGEFEIDDDAVLGSNVVLELNDGDFEQQIKDGPIIIKFFAPWVCV